MNAPVPDQRGRVVLITGGTRGIGLATARAFARCGAQTILTCRWGTADPDELRREFVEMGALPPMIVEADVANAADTDRLIAEIAATYGRVDVFISNASLSLLVKDLDDYTERGFFQSLRASAWPTFGYLQAMRKQLPALPRYVVLMSSDGPDRYTNAYDFVAASKAVSETLLRYWQFRLRDQPVNLNVIRSRAVRTESFDSTFGGEFYGFLRKFVDDEWFMTSEEVADAALALASGWMDAVRGQVITVDRGSTFGDGVSFLYNEREKRGL